MQLSPECARVLGSLMEKGLTTPQQYPLTINALVGACNQTSNREPVVTYGETTVLDALDELKDQRLVRFVLPSHGRSVVRYREVLEETLGLDARQCAILAVLLLRGPQTVGELRIRTERMAPFDGLDEIEHELDLLRSRDELLAENIGRRPGQKEERWASPLLPTRVEDAAPATGTHPGQPSALDPEATAAAAAAATAAATAADGVLPALDDLRAELRALGSEVAELRQDLEALRASLGG